MIHKNDILKMVRHIHRRNQGGVDHKMMHPEREWGIGLFIFVLIVVVGSAYSLFTWGQVSNLDETVQVDSSGVEQFDTVRFERALEQYRNKQQVFETILVTSPQVLTTPAATTTASTTPEIETGAVETDISTTTEESL